MTSGTVLAGGQMTDYGFGFHVYDSGRRRVAWHDGTVLGYKAMNSLLPATCDAVVVLGNADYFHAPIVAMRIEHALFGMPGGEGERFDPNLPRWSMLLAATLAALPLLVAFAAGRRRWSAAGIALMTYAIGTVWLPGGVALSVAGVALVARGGRAGARARKRAIE